MQLSNIPIEAISKCDAEGTIIPLKIRLKDENHNLITAPITSIVCSMENNFAGTKTLDYRCKVMITGEREQLLELRYHVAAHKWTIRKILY